MRVSAFSPCAAGPEADDRVLAAELDASAAKDFRVNMAGRAGVLFEPLDVGEMLRDLHPEARPLRCGDRGSAPVPGMETATLFRLAGVGDPRVS
jgi:hypothetical protein